MKNINNINNENPCPAMICNVRGGGGCRLKTRFLFENYPFNHKVSPCHREASAEGSIDGTNRILQRYCVSSGVSGLCPDGIRLEIFKLCNENLLCRSEQKFSLQSFKISFNSAGFSFLWFVSFLLPAQSKRKEMNIRKSHFEHSSYPKQESNKRI